MASFTKYRLADICEIQIGKTPRRSVGKYWGEGHPWVSISDMRSRTITETKEQITNIAVEDCGCKMVVKGTILLSFKLSIGKVAFAGMNLFTNEAIAALPIKRPELIHPNYLYYALKNIPLTGSNNAAKGSTLNKESLQALQLPAPKSLDDQIRIADILGKVESLIHQRNESLRLLDEFLKSTFLEMFGDRKHTNVKEYLIDELKQGGSDTFSNGPFGSNLLTSELTNDGVPVIYIRDIRHGEFSWRSNVYVTKEKADSLRSCQVKEGDVLIAKVGDPPGISAVYPKGAGTAIITQDVIRLRLNTSFILPEYFTHYLNSSLGKQLIKRISIEGTRNRFPLGAFKTLAIPVPALDKQIHFQRLAENVQVVKKHAQESLSQLCNLYASLSQKAFKGELQVTNK
jgi:type I restriction enzyme S subunit